MRYSARQRMCSGLPGRYIPHRVHLHRGSFGSRVVCVVATGYLTTLKTLQEAPILIENTISFKLREVDLLDSLDVLNGNELSYEEQLPSCE